MPSLFGTAKVWMVQAHLESSISFNYLVVLYSAGNSFFSADDDYDLLGASHSRIEQVFLQHDIVLHSKRHYDDGILGALRLMNGDCIGQDQLIQICIMPPVVKT